MKPLFVALFHMAWLCMGPAICDFAIAKNSTAAQFDAEDKKTSSSDALAEAVTHFYHKDYARALPIFKRIAETNPSLDIQFWLAYSASKTGECQLAIENYREILKKHPGHKDVSFELARTYAACGEQDLARREFKMILMNSPSPQMRADIEELLTKMKQTSWALRLSQGFQYDDNITSGPSESVIKDAIDIIPVEKNLKKKESVNWLTDIRGDLSYDMGAPGHFLMYSTAFLFNSHSMEDTDFNYMEIELTTGPLLRSWPNAASIPIGFSYIQYGGTSLSTRFFISPEAEHFVSNSFSLKCRYTLSSEKYAESDYSDVGYDNISQMLDIGPKLYLDDKKHILTANFSLQYADADASMHSFEAYGGTVTYFTSFKTKTDLYAMYKYTRKDYDGPPINYTRKRHDNRDAFIIIIGQDIYSKFFVSAEIAYIHNDSNADLYDFEKITSTLTAGLKI
ncbi:MAG: DUF560 domain-containing protein [Proteobacteria bacterium]|nr:DUF560 domain-containing protein [Pseudomonadota bacterium]